MNIITGYRGEPHITSAQDRAGNQGSYGTASYVLNVGSKFAATVVSANEIRLADGILSHQGCLAIIETGTYDSVSINNGAQGMNRIDRIVARYTKDSETNVESVELAVIQGTATASTPSAPAYNQGTIATGSTPVDMPLYQVRLTGITVTSCTAEFDTVRTQKEMDTLLGNTSISGIGGGTVTGAISALNSKSIQIASLHTGVTLTTTNTNYSTYSSRKFSDYDLIIFQIGASANNCRRSVVLPKASWNTGGKNINEAVFHGNNLDQACAITISYASDTSFSAYVSGSGVINYLLVYGVKLSA